MRKDANPEAAFKRTDVNVVESAYVFPFIAHAPLEPPPILSAVCNAIFTATGERIRTLPMTK